MKTCSSQFSLPLFFAPFFFCIIVLVSFIPFFLVLMPPFIFHRDFLVPLKPQTYTLTKLNWPDVFLYVPSDYFGIVILVCQRVGQGPEVVMLCYRRIQ